MSECRRCSEEVTWCRTPNGKMMPVQEDPDGKLVLIDEGDTHVTCRVAVPHHNPAHKGLTRYTGHFDFCEPDT